MSAAAITGSAVAEKYLAPVSSRCRGVGVDPYRREIGEGHGRIPTTAFLIMSAAPDVPDHAVDEHRTARGKGPRWPTWVLAALTVAAAAFVMLFALGGVMSTAGCSAGTCPNTGPQWLFGVLFYGAPVVAALAVIGSLVVARRRRGFLLPLCGLLLIAVDFAVLMAMFRP